jgi:hypothetical protein
MSKLQVPSQSLPLDVLVKEIGQLAIANEKKSVAMVSYAKAYGFALNDPTTTKQMMAAALIHAFTRLYAISTTAWTTFNQSFCQGRLNKYNPIYEPLSPTALNEAWTVRRLCNKLISSDFIYGQKIEVGLHAEMADLPQNLSASELTSSRVPSMSQNPPIPTPRPASVSHILHRLRQNLLKVGFIFQSFNAIGRHAPSPLYLSPV